MERLSESTGYSLPRERVPDNAREKRKYCRFYRTFDFSIRIVVYGGRIVLNNTDGDENGYSAR